MKSVVTLTGCSKTYNYDIVIIINWNFIKHCVTQLYFCCNNYGVMIDGILTYQFMILI